MHPIELTDFLQGWDIVGENLNESWESMLPDWILTIEWMTANYQNEVEVLLLLSKSWKEFGLSELRKERYRAINKVCREFGIICGAVSVFSLPSFLSSCLLVLFFFNPVRPPPPKQQDAPIALVQQHAWALIDRPYPNDPEGAAESIRANSSPLFPFFFFVLLFVLLFVQTFFIINICLLLNLENAVDWWMDAGFDFVSTENGFSEFQSGNCTTMLSWMNELTRYTNDKYNKDVFIKVHISTGQFCPEFLDPITGQPINFNYLPIFADQRLGLLPHTVQFYALDDPA